MAVNIDAVAVQVHESTLLTGGASVNRFVSPPASGYMVGGLVNEETWNIASFEREGVTWVSDFIEAHYDMLSDSEFYVGAWLNTETSMVHLDVSEQFETEGAAILFARERRQLAYWDVRASKEVRIMDPEYQNR